MKKRVFILALFILLKPVFPVLEYVVNYDYISKVLCINKEKPKLECNGKCHLMKELAKASDTSDSLPSNKKTVSPMQEVLFFHEINSLSFLSLRFIEKNQLNIDYSNLYSYLNGNAIFRPPIFIS